ncbi:MAG: hypothetical protein LUE98_06670 [Tannerellaceae bacterium]|nr:hypothetical protein [Tannerellaceae bacterium]MCD8177102.1 hypothetical protein [Tannerellaceae bacterium]
MSFKYHVVRKADMRKGASKGDQLYYGQIRAGESITFRNICDSICATSTIFRGDVPVIIKALLHVMQQELANGLTVHLGDFGSFRMIAGSKGVEEAKKFHPSMFKKARIVFTPGVMLKDVANEVHFEKLGEVVRTVPQDDCPLPHV